MKINRSLLIQWLSQGLVLISLLLLSGCAGSTNPDIQTMLQNLSRSYVPLWKLVTAAAYVLGTLLIFKGVYTLKIYGDMRTMMSSNASLKTPLMYIAAGCGLLYSQTAFQILMGSSFGYTAIMPYTGDSLKGWSTTSMEALIGLVQLFGLFAFIRGWMYISRSAEQNGQPGVFARGLTHIIGGLLAINIAGTKEILWNTFGFS